MSDTNLFSDAAIAAAITATSSASSVASICSASAGIAAGAGAITKMVYQNGERIDRIANVKSLEDYITRIDEMIERKREGFMKYR